MITVEWAVPVGRCMWSSFQGFFKPSVFHFQTKRRTWRLWRTLSAPECKGARHTTSILVRLIHSRATNVGCFRRLAPQKPLGPSLTDWVVAPTTDTFNSLLRLLIRRLPLNWLENFVVSLTSFIRNLSASGTSHALVSLVYGLWHYYYLKRQPLLQFPFDANSTTAFPASKRLRKNVNIRMSVCPRHVMWHDTWRFTPELLLARI